MLLGFPHDFIIRDFIETSTLFDVDFHTMLLPHNLNWVSTLVVWISTRF
jgi:hypothetical protein